MQRLKLERQERIIMELKLHKLSEEAKEARQELKNELKSVIRSGDPKSKAKAKCLQLIGNLKDEEDDDLNKLQGRALLMPKFLQNMQERALERNVRHEQAKQRRHHQEAEREAQKFALEEAKVIIFYFSFPKYYFIDHLLFSFSVLKMKKLNDYALKP